eukprot:TRINITY_DN93896_c0_g1_i1.p1 TRINITY_DN93896_c0_g1~~TRINITY_DN93896_c0_g1_i1.p1  ORF type:complete len:326 (+),score=40.67 TRINITY_DN93896_c0_g1_i1:132-1109(+)
MMMSVRVNGTPRAWHATPRPLPGLPVSPKAKEEPDEDLFAFILHPVDDLKAWMERVLGCSSCVCLKEAEKLVVKGTAMKRKFSKGKWRLLRDDDIATADIKVVEVTYRAGNELPWDWWTWSKKPSSSETGGLSERDKRNERNKLLERSERHDRNERIERIECNERIEHGERSERVERSERIARGCSPRNEARPPWDIQPLSEAPAGNNHLIWHILEHGALPKQLRASYKWEQTATPEASATEHKENVGLSGNDANVDSTVVSSLPERKAIMGLLGNDTNVDSKASQELSRMESLDQTWEQVTRKARERSSSKDAPVGMVKARVPC